MNVLERKKLKFQSLRVSQFFLWDVEEIFVAYAVVYIVMCVYCVCKSLKICTFELIRFSFID